MCAWHVLSKFPSTIIVPVCGSLVCAFLREKERAFSASQSGGVARYTSDKLQAREKEREREKADSVFLRSVDRARNCRAEMTLMLLVASYTL